MGPDGTIVGAFSRGRVGRWNGSEWSLLRTRGDRAQDLWVSPQNTVHIVGKKYAVLADDRWRTQKLDLPDDLITVWGPGDGDVWVGGYGPDVARCEAGHWQTMHTGLPNDDMSYLAGIAGGLNDVFVGGEEGVAHFDGTTWRTLPTPEHSCVHGAATLSDGRVALCGVSADGPLLLVGDRHGLEPIDVGNDDEELQRIAVGPGDDLFVTSGRALLRVRDHEVTTERICPKFDCYAVASDGDTVATQTSEGLCILRGGTWSVCPTAG
jgi:hypothetical protein